MTPFGYLRDRLFLICCGLYALNRWVIKPSFPGGVFAFWFNDFLLIPCAVPVCLWLWRRAGLRRHDRPPTATETTCLLLLWTFLFEVVGPHLTARATPDWRDVVAYAAGAVLAWFWWNRRRLAPGCGLVLPPTAGPS